LGRDMAIVLSSGKVRRTGAGEASLVEGQSLRIETSPNGEELLNVVVPAGKTWKVNIAVVVDEIDA